MIWGIGAVCILLYIVSTCRWGREFFSDRILLIRWMKSSGYHFYRKIVCRYIYQPVDVTECKNYRRLQQIHVKKDVSEEWREYQSERYALFLTGILAVFVAGGGFSLFLGHADPISEYQLQRPEYGSAAEGYSFIAEDEDGQQEEIHLELEAQIYSQQEIEKIFEDYCEVLEEKVKGKNASLQEVRTDLDFEPDEGWQGIDISWRPSDYGIITEQGKIVLEQAQEGETDLSLYLFMSHAQYSKTFEIPVKVVKYPSDSAESLQSYLLKMQSEKQEEAVLELPEMFEGKTIQYIPETDYSMVVGIILLIVTVTVLLLYKQQAVIKEQCIKREQQMKADYPEIISKLLILIRAGMPVRSAWVRIVEDYQMQKQKNGSMHFALEEMHTAIRDMENGISEGDAYLEFGKRCEQHLYLKLGSLLEQNLKKGNYGISALLEGERIQALEERRRQIRASGELAGTKLMMPMVALFSLVLVIIIVPSFMTFGV